jgi:hypothetical protein
MWVDGRDVIKVLPARAEARVADCVNAADMG